MPTAWLFLLKKPGRSSMNGLAYEQQGQMDEAVSQFQAALDVSLTTITSDLTNEIRGTAPLCL